VAVLWQNQSENSLVGSLDPVALLVHKSLVGRQKSFTISMNTNPPDWVRDQEVAGSNPVTPIMLQWHRIHVAVVLSSVLEQE
jgi:hypothetical protein